jgi:hypothetical protein
VRCEVEVRGLDDIRHKVEVDANTLYEAAALGIATLRKAAFQVDIFPTMEIFVTVHPPATLHVVRYEKLTNWVKSSGPPNEVPAKQKLAKVLAGE